MNRPIKFRAWHYGAKQMLYAGFLDGNWYDLENKCWGGKKDEELRVGVDLSALMQYTGQKDAHGEELYEDDILEDDAEWYRVVWGNGEWIAQSLSTRRGDDMSLSEFRGSHTCFKQGNIYQNPELLNAR